MTMVTTGLNAVASLFAKSGNTVQYTAIGAGSTTITVGDTTLNSEFDRNILIQPEQDLQDLLIVEGANVTAISNFSSVEMSGLTVREFGTFNTAISGTMFNREVIGSVTFDGSIELQTHNTFRFTQA